MTIQFLSLIWGCKDCYGTRVLQINRTRTIVHVPVPLYCGLCSADLLISRGPRIACEHRSLLFSPFLFRFLFYCFSFLVRRRKGEKGNKKKRWIITWFLSHCPIENTTQASFSSYYRIKQLFSWQFDMLLVFPWYMWSQLGAGSFFFSENLIACTYHRSYYL